MHHRAHTFTLLHRERVAAATMLVALALLLYMTLTADWIRRANGLPRAPNAPDSGAACDVAAAGSHADDGSGGRPESWPRWQHFEGPVDIDIIHTKLASAVETDSRWCQAFLQKFSAVAARKPSSSVPQKFSQSATFHAHDRTGWEWCSTARAVHNMRALATDAAHPFPRALFLASTVAGNNVDGLHTSPVPVYFESIGVKVTVGVVASTANTLADVRIGLDNDKGGDLVHIERIGGSLPDVLLRHPPNEGYDFTWSGDGVASGSRSIDDAITFIVSTCLATRVEGIIVHSVEFLLDRPNGAGVEEVGNVVFSAEDVERLAMRLFDVGCRLMPRRLHVPAGSRENAIDVAPFRSRYHFRAARWVASQRVTTTTVILVAKRLFER